jgi:hypothetical protein
MAVVKWFGWLALSIFAAMGGYNFTDLVLGQWFLVVACFVAVWKSKKIFRTWASELPQDYIVQLGLTVFGLGSYFTSFIENELQKSFYQGVVVGLSLLAPLLIFAQKERQERNYDPLSDPENHY